jgi:hypothetical protein
MHRIRQNGKAARNYTDRAFENGKRNVDVNRHKACPLRLVISLPIVVHYKILA